jgi:hypothetical protein
MHVLNLRWPSQIRTTLAFTQLAVSVCECRPGENYLLKVSLDNAQMHTTVSLLRNAIGASLDLPISGSCICPPTDADGQLSRVMRSRLQHS